MNNLLPEFEILRPETLDEALAALAVPQSRALAGGTDLVVNLRRGIGAPERLVDLTHVPGMGGIEVDNDTLVIGAGVTLRELVESPALGPAEAALAQAAAAVAGPAHRNMATVGGNLCLDTRCIYYNQSAWWRKSNGYCLKYRGDTCHVAPQGKRCRAAFSGDLAPAFLVLGAEAEIAGPQGVRRIALTEMYQEDGAAHLTLGPNEILLRLHLPRGAGRSGYAKVRLRGAMEFPLAGVAALCRPVDRGTEVTLGLTGTNSRPMLMAPRRLPSGDGAGFFATLEKEVQKTVSPQRTSPLPAHYRRLSVAAEAVRLVRGLADA